MGYLRPGKRGVNVSPRASSARSSTFRDLHLFALLFGVISLLYATVGQAGGMAFLALLAFAAFPSTEIRPTALALNVVAAAYSTWVIISQKSRRLEKATAASAFVATDGAHRFIDRAGPQRYTCAYRPYVCFSPAPRSSCGSRRSGAPLLSRATSISKSSSGAA